MNAVDRTDGCPRSHRALTNHDPRRTAVRDRQARARHACSSSYRADECGLPGKLPEFSQEFAYALPSTTARRYFRDHRRTRRAASHADPAKDTIAWYPFSAGTIHQLLQLGILLSHRLVAYKLTASAAAKLRRRTLGPILRFRRGYRVRLQDCPF